MDNLVENVSKRFTEKLIDNGGFNFAMHFYLCCCWYSLFTCIAMYLNSGIYLIMLMLN